MPTRPLRTRFVPQPRSVVDLLSAALAFLPFAATGCAPSYRPPGAAASPSMLAEGDIQERLNRQPAAPFPARLATARIQAPGYRSMGADSYGQGRYSVVTAREVEKDEHFQRVAKLPMIA